MFISIKNYEEVFEAQFFNDNVGASIIPLIPEHQYLAVFFQAF